jgi:hypothetical protein
VRTDPALGELEIFISSGQIWIKLL